MVFLCTKDQMPVLKYQALQGLCDNSLLYWPLNRNFWVLLQAFKYLLKHPLKKKNQIKTITLCIYLESWDRIFLSLCTIPLTLLLLAAGPVRGADSAQELPLPSQAQVCKPRQAWQGAGSVGALQAVQGRKSNPQAAGIPHPSVLTHCCGQRASKARRSFWHSAAPSPWLSRHCQNSSRAPQHAFLSSIVGAAIPAAALDTAHGGCPSAPRPARGAGLRERRCQGQGDRLALTRPGRSRSGSDPGACSSHRLSLPIACPSHRLSLPSLVRPSPPPVPPRGAGADLPELAHPPEGFPPIPSPPGLL